MTRTSKLLAALLVLASAGLAAADEEVLASGRWTEKNYEVAGGWRIVAVGDERFVELDEDFKTRRAPDLKLFLSPLPLAELDDRNATRGATRIAELEGHRGAARYPIDPTVDLSEFLTLILHCEQYSKLWAGWPLKVE